MTETVKLSIPIQINGVSTDRLVMRRPKLKDFRNAAKMAGKDQEEQEIRLFCILTDCAPSDLEELDFADYRKLQRAFQRLSAESFDTGDT
ncbi:MAG: phage tail assembly protein [Betaproteobacteria bacterium]|nr:phage tail assembly protein [Betaproteobacteria bacterium]